MKAGTSSNRRFFYVISLLVILGGLNGGLLWYLKKDDAPKWEFIEKVDGTILLGNVKLLEGGYLEIRDAYQLVYTRPEFTQFASEQFRGEVLSQGFVRVEHVATFNNVRVGPAEVKQWGAVPKGSTIEMRLNQLATGRGIKSYE